MATTPEGKVKAEAVKLYKLYGAKYDRAAQNGMGRNGRADDIVCRRPDGHFIGVEFKKLDVFDVTALQRTWLNETAVNGGSAMVVNATNLDLLERVLRTPGCQCVAYFDETKPNRCIGHRVYKGDVLWRDIPVTGEKK